MSDDVELGPIDYLVVEYAHGKPTGEALPYLLDLVASGTIRILDLAMLVKDDETHFRSMKLADLPALGITDFDDLDGVESGLLSEDDLAEVAAIIEPGRAAAILIYENSWAGPSQRPPAAGRRLTGGQRSDQRQRPARHPAVRRVRHLHRLILN